ncbi:MAG TPA: ArsC family reductase [Rhodocyclaceae bacterium]|nr:ArsC family reductase [Zoogloeaceae bacterium]HRD35205.1 ArsC family reductase [Rhodocyclaceae bacterium]
MSITIYGIKNCSTMKKAFDWLNERGVAYRFHDYKKGGIDAETLQRWCDRAGREALINTRGTTWRKLDEHRRAVATDAAAIALMAEHPSLIRRPVVELPDGSLLLGFDPTRFEAALAPSGGGA